MSSGSRAHSFSTGHGWGCCIGLSSIGWGQSQEAVLFTTSDPSARCYHLELHVQWFCTQPSELRCWCSRFPPGILKCKVQGLCMKHPMSKWNYKRKKRKRKKKFRLYHPDSIFISQELLMNFARDSFIPTSHSETLIHSDILKMHFKSHLGHH